MGFSSSVSVHLIVTQSLASLSTFQLETEHPVGLGALRNVSQRLHSNSGHSPDGADPGIATYFQGGKQPNLGNGHGKHSN